MCTLEGEGCANGVPRSVSDTADGVLCGTGSEALLLVPVDWAALDWSSVKGSGCGRGRGRRVDGGSPTRGAGIKLARQLRYLLAEASMW